MQPTNLDFGHSFRKDIAPLRQQLPRSLNANRLHTALLTGIKIYIVQVLELVFRRAECTVHFISAESRICSACSISISRSTTCCDLLREIRTICYLRMAPWLVDS